MAKWLYLLDPSWTWKTHVVPEALVEGLRQDFAARHPECADGFQEEPVPAEGAFWDLPGMIWTGRSYREVEVDGLKLTVPSQDWASLVFELKLRTVRVFPTGEQYYKLHHWRNPCFVFTPAQRDALIAALEAQQDAADAEAEQDNKRFLAGIDEINKDGVKVVSARAEMIREAQKGSAGKN